jgi:hypothetical protein
MKAVNGWEQVQLGFVLVIGAFSGGIVSFLFGQKAAFVVNILSFLIAAALTSRISGLDDASEHQANHAGTKVTGNGLLSVIFSSSLFIMLLSADIFIPLANGIENVLISVYAENTFHAADLGVGILYSVLGIGFIISPLLTRIIKGHFLLFAYLAMIIEGIILFIVSQLNSFTMIAILFGILTVFGGVGNALLDTVVMKIMLQKHQGSYFALSATIGNSSLGLSMFVTGLLLGVFEPRTLGAVNGLLYILFGGIFLLWSIHVLRRKSIAWE